MPTLDERIEAAERLAQELETAGYDNGLMNDTAAALIRAQAAEIARHPAALQEARNAALREAANIVRGEVYLKHYRTWVIWPPYDDLTQERPNVSENHGKARHCDQLADAILTLIDTPATPVEPWIPEMAPGHTDMMVTPESLDAWLEDNPLPAEPAGDALREVVIDVAAHLAAAISLLERGGKGAKKAAPSNKMFDQMLVDYRSSLNRARAALAAAPDPQPDADERGYRNRPDVEVTT